MTEVPNSVSNLNQPKKVNVHRLIAENAEMKGDLARAINAMSKLIDTLGLTPDKFKGINSIEQGIPVVMTTLSNLMMPGRLDMGTIQGLISEFPMLLDKYKTLVEPNPQEMNVENQQKQIENNEG